MQLNKKIFSTCVLLIIVFFVPFMVFAQGVAPAGFINPIGAVTPQSFLNQIINFLLKLVGGLALVAIIWGGIMYIVSLGDDNKVKKAKAILFWAVVGLAVIVLAVAIINTVFTALGV